METVSCPIPVNLLSWPWEGSRRADGSGVGVDAAAAVGLEAVYLSSGNLMGVLTHPTKWSQGTLRSGNGAFGEFSWEEALARRPALG